MAQACRGLTKRGQPCSITWGLTSHGFCKFHVPGAGQCRGIARSTGSRCRIKWGLDDSGYCHHHRAQSAAGGLQCVAIAQSTGQRCQKTVGIDQSGFCSAHNPSGAGTPTCHGNLLGSAIPCTNPAKPQYKYCCAAHDPSVRYYAPSLFGDPKLRSHKKSDVVKLYGGRDLYHGDRLDLATKGFLEMDHILEKQCFSYAFQSVPFRDDSEDVDFLAALVREGVANELPNLCLTRASTNKIKGAAVWKFLDDCLTGHVGYQGSATFNDYLVAENRDAMRLGRETTRVISGEMGAALKFCQRRLADEGETPIIDALSDQLQKLYVRMQLHTSRSAIVLAARTKAQPSSAKCVGVTRVESVADAVASLCASAVSFTPRVIQVGDSTNQSNVNARTEREGAKAVESCDLVAEFHTDANADKKLDSSVPGGQIVTNNAVCRADSKPAVSTSTQTSAKLKTLDAIAEPFVPRAVQQQSDHTSSKTIVSDKKNPPEARREHEPSEEIHDDPSPLN